MAAIAPSKILDKCNNKQTSAFYLWVETSSAKTHRSRKHIHPYHLTAADLEVFLRNEIGIAATAIDKISERIYPKYFALLMANHQALLG